MLRRHIVECLDRTQEVASSSPASSITGTRSSHLAARQASNPKRSQFANFAISAAVSPRAAGNKCRDSANEKRG